jgi:protein-tyrosine-phosphatase
MPRGKHGDMMVETSARPQPKDNDVPSNLVLFVCVENSFRSVLSEALFNAKAPKGWHAESAGVKPAPHINPLVEDLLHGIGVEVGPKTPQLVNDDLVKKASIVVTFGCLDRCPRGTEAKSEDWSVPTSIDKNWDELTAIRDEVSRRVDELISRIRAGRLAVA